MTKTALITGVTGPGRQLPRRAAARQRATRCTASCAGARACSTPQRIDHLYVDPHRRTRASSCTTATCRTTVRAAQRARRGAARRGLQPRRAEPRARQLRPARVHRRRRRPSARCACSRRSAATGARRKRPLLPGRGSEMFGRSPSARSTRRTPFQPRSPYALRQGVRALPRDRTTARAYGLFASQRHPVQPREPAPRRDASSRARSRARRRASSWACRTSCTSATSTRAATGASPATTSRRCGACCSTTSPMTTWCHRRSRSPFAISSISRSASSTWTGSAMSRSIRGTFALPRCDHLEGDSASAAASWTGSRRPTSAHWRA